MKTIKDNKLNKQIDCSSYLSNSYLVNAKAQFGKEGLTPKIFLIREELHFTTIPLVGRFENNSFLIH